MGFKIEIRQGEGRNDSPYLNKWVSFYNVAAANHFLYTQSFDAPKTGGYNKHDFRITLDNGSVYTGRLDVDYQQTDTDILKHLRDMKYFLKVHKQTQGLKSIRPILRELEQENKKFYSTKKSTKQDSGQGGWFRESRRHRDAQIRSKRKRIENRLAKHGLKYFRGRAYYQWQIDEWKQVKNLHGKKYADKWFDGKFKR